MFYGLNIDPANPYGNPTPAELYALGAKVVRYTFKDFSGGQEPDPNQVQFYSQKAQAYAQAGLKSLLILTYESYANPPAPDASDAVWDEFITNFAHRAGQIAQIFARWQPVIQIWNEPDLPPDEQYKPTLREAVFGRMLNRSYAAIKAVAPEVKVITAGLASGNPAWLQRVIQSLGGKLPADAVAIHPYGQRPEPNWPSPTWLFGYVGDLIDGYRRVINLPIWVSEIGLNMLTEQEKAEYLRRFYTTISTLYKDVVTSVNWFCYSDGMVLPYGLIEKNGQRKQLYYAYQQIATATAPPPPLPPGPATPLDQLHRFAHYLERQIAFGVYDRAVEDQMNSDVRGKQAALSQAEIGQLAAQMLAGSSHLLLTQEVEGLSLLQQEKDLYGMLKAIVLATHQRTGALSGRVGFHVRVSAEIEANAITNISAILNCLRRIEPGRRLIVMDMVKVMPDESKLTVPDLFDTPIYGQHRNGLIENHAWNLQKLVYAIRNNNYQDRVLLLIRLDGPDNGANVNVFNTDSLRRYELAIWKFVRYLETVLPHTPFKLALGNEPDLPHERQWSNPNADPYDFTINQFAPMMGAFMKKLARKRPDVTFLCPALSGLMKYAYLDYYTRFFGTQRPHNVVPAVHGYAGDLSIPQQPGQQNLIEQQALSLRLAGGFQHISGTELGSGSPFGDVEYLSDKGRFDDAVIWLMLSINHQPHPGQDNAWRFTIDPTVDDPNARHMADLVNRTQERVLRNIRDRSGTLQIITGQVIPPPLYAVSYESHNTPTTIVLGKISTVTITLRNTSSRVWLMQGEKRIRLGYHWYTGDGQLFDPAKWDDIRTALPQDVPPGTSIALNARLAPPKAAGTYILRWDLVEEGITWFAEKGVPTLNVAVVITTESVPPPPPPPPSGLSVSSSHNNVSQGPDNLLLALDSDPATRWSSNSPQQPGMWFKIDLGKTQQVGQVQLDNAGSPNDYPRGYIVRVSADGQTWQEVARQPNNTRPLNIIFSPRQSRYIQIEQTGSDPIYWWSIHSFQIGAGSGGITTTLSASHNNVTQGPDNLLLALDNNPATRWSSNSPQQPGMWFKIDLGEARQVGQVELDNAGSPNDYPRGYIVRLSADGQTWQEVARQPNNTRPLNIIFSPRQSRYIQIEQTGSDPFYWWSIHELKIRGAVTLSASHNNVQTGPDNLFQAFDNNPTTRWSSSAPQQPGMWFQIDLGQAQPVSGLTLDQAGSGGDYPRGYIVRLSTDGQTWQEMARNNSNNQALDVSFNPTSARYIRAEQTGSDPIHWWSIHELEVRLNQPPCAGEIRLSARASHNNVQTGYDNLAHALDDKAETRWSTVARQEPGMWFELDLNTTCTVRGLILDNATSPNDYPRGYIIRLSTDGQNWQEVARNADNTRAVVDLTFTPTLARYIRIEQTGTSTFYWWSIHKVAVKT